MRSLHLSVLAASLALALPSAAQQPPTPARPAPEVIDIFRSGRFFLTFCGGNSTYETEYISQNGRVRVLDAQLNRHPAPGTYAVIRYRPSAPRTLRIQPWACAPREEVDVVVHGGPIEILPAASEREAREMLARHRR